MARKIRIKRKVSGTGAPPVLEYGELACDTAGTIYIGDINGVPVTIQGGGGVTQDLYGVIANTNPNGLFPSLPNALMTDMTGRGLILGTSINTIDANSPIFGVVNTGTSDYLTQNMNFTGATTDAMHFSYNLGTVTNAISFLGNDATASTQGLQFLFNQGTTGLGLTNINTGTTSIAMDFMSNQGTVSSMSYIQNQSGATSSVLQYIQNQSTVSPALILQHINNQGTANYGQVIFNEAGNTLTVFQQSTNSGTSSAFASFINGGSIAAFSEYTNSGAGSMSGANREMIRIQNLSSAANPNDVRKMLVVRNDGVVGDSVVYISNINSEIPAIEVSQQTTASDLRLSYNRVSDPITPVNGDIWLRHDENRLKYYMNGVRSLAIEEKSVAGGISVLPTATSVIYTFSNLETLGVEVLLGINDGTNTRITKVNVVYDGTLVNAFVSPEFGAIDSGSFGTYVLGTSITGNDVSLTLNNTSASLMTVWYKAIKVEI